MKRRLRSTNFAFYNDEEFNNIKTQNIDIILSSNLPLKPSTNLPVNYLQKGQIAYDNSTNKIMCNTGFVWFDLGTGIGTVTEVNTGTGLTGGPITNVGTISVLNINTIIPGTYTNPTITVNQQGQITEITNGLTPINIIESLANTITPTNEGEEFGM